MSKLSKADFERCRCRMMEAGIDISHWMLSSECEKKFEWRKWMKEIPAINFPKHWFIQITPPLAAAIVRFRVSKSTESKSQVSVYLDCYDHLGSISYAEKPEPYWEIYPNSSGDIDRYPMNDVAGLIQGITKALDVFED